MSEEPKQRLTSASKSSLPDAAEMPDTDASETAIALMREAGMLRIVVSEAEERLEEIKSELSSLCEVYEMKGFRHGLNGFEYHGWQKRKTFSREKAVTLIPVDVLDQCYVDNKPYVSTKFVAFDIA
jgi:hypothetical protein